MNNDAEKNVRAEQIAATILYRYFGNITITRPKNQLYDMLVAYNDGTGLLFGVEVKRQTAEPLDKDSIVNLVSKIDFGDKDNRLPIILLYVNEETETSKVGFVLGWRYGKPQIYKNFELRNLNEKTANLCLQIIKSMDEVVRVLSMEEFNVIKRISFSKIVGKGLRQRAEVIYLRRMSSEYRMNHKEIVSERERLERLMKGIPQEEYPNDELDRVVFGAICEKFSDAKAKSSLLLLSSELEKLQLYKQWHCHHTQLIVSPDVSNMPSMLLTILDGLEVFNVDIDIYVENFLYPQSFADVSFCKKVPIEGWVKKVTELNELKGSLRQISFYFR